MFMPSIFNDSLFDDLMSDVDHRLYGHRSRNMMKTDVKDVGDHYEVDMDLPGFKKEEISVRYDHGYLSISATKGLDDTKQATDGTYVIKERSMGQMSRSFYVGEFNKEAIHCKYDNGVLSIEIPKVDTHVIENDTSIGIE